VQAGGLGPAAAALVRLDLLRREDPPEFFHPVVRRAVYETLDVVERGAAHRSATELLLEAGTPPESAAVYLLRVAPGADRFVVATLRQAAERSLAQGAADAAVGYLTRTLDEQLDPPSRAEVLVEDRDRKTRAGRRGATPGGRDSPAGPVRQSKQRAVAQLGR
jgi:hypothetical protein